MSKNKNELMSLSGAIFTGVGSAIGVALVAYIGFVIASAGKASIFSIFLGLMIGLLSGFPMYFLTKHAVLHGGQSSVIDLGLGKESAAFNAYSYAISLGFMSTYPVSISTYVVSAFPALAPYQLILSISILILAICVLCFGVKIFEKSSKLFSTLLLIGLTTFVILGLIRMVQNGAKPFDFSDDPIFTQNGINGILTAVPLFAGTCGGFVNIGYLGNLVSEPKKNVPKAIIATSIVMSFFWISLTFVAANVLPVEQVAGQPLTAVAKELMPEWMAIAFVITGPAMAILTTFIPGIPMTANSIGMMASRGYLPRFLAPKEGSTGINRPLIIMMGTLMGVIILFKLPVNVIVANTNPCISFGCVLLPNLAHLMIALRRTDIVENKKDLLLYRIFAALGVCAGLFLFILSVRAISLVSAVINISLIVIAYAFCFWKSKRDSKETAAK